MAQTKTVAKAATLDLATLASDSKNASGFENLDVSRDTAIPYINILQSGSPQIIHQKRNTYSEQRWDNSTILSLKK